MKIEPVIVFQGNQRSQCLHARMVLEAVGIPSTIEQINQAWCLSVHPDQKAAAYEELIEYQQENTEKPKANQVTPIFPGSIVGVFGYASILCLIAYDRASPATQIPWLEAGRVDVGDVWTGQWRRVFTALTLHADAQHLLSNLVYGGVFGLLAGRLLGGGVAWALIVIAGGLGNLLNVMVRDTSHTSVGASTAVFAALGILVAHALRPRSTDSQSTLKRWSPLIGGLLMLSLFGVGGERTDVVAHATGFLSGLMLGWLGCRIPEQILGNRMIQWTCGWAAVVLIAAAWLIALASR